MSHSYIDPKNDYYNVNDDSDTAQKKIDPVAQAKWLSTPQVHGGWGLFHNQSANNETVQRKLDDDPDKKNVNDDNTITLSRGVFIFMSEGSFNSDDFDVRYPHYPLNVYLFQKLSKDQLADIKSSKLKIDRYKDSGSNGIFNADATGEYYKVSSKSRHDIATYTGLTADQKIGQDDSSTSGVTIGMGIDIGNKWSENQKEDCKTFFINNGKIKKETAEKLSECVGLKGVDAAKKTAEIRGDIKLTTDEVLNLLSGIITDYDRTNERIDTYHDAVKEALNYTRYWGDTKLRTTIKNAAKDKTGVEQLNAVKEAVKTDMDKLPKGSFKIPGYKKFYAYFEIIAEMESYGKTVKFADKVSDKSILIKESDPTFMFIKDVTERTNDKLIGKDFRKQISGEALPDHIKGAVGSKKTAANNKEDIEIVQQWLFNANYDVEVNGTLDEKTKTAIKAFTKSIFGKEYDTIDPKKTAIKHLNKYKYTKHDEVTTEDKE